LGISTLQKTRIGSYILRQMLGGQRRFPLVLMLEPLFACNLACKGCGKIAYPADVMQRRLGVAECVQAAEECGAPVVSIPGGEPLLHPEIHGIVRQLVDRKRFVYLCTNALLVEKRIDDFEPSPYLAFNVHIDSLRERHDHLANRTGVFDTAVAAIRLLLSRGFRVTTNTTLFGGETPENAARLFDFLSSLGIEGMTISPGFSYEMASDQDHFLDREGIKDMFGEIFRLGRGRGWKFNHSSLYLDFLAGNKEYSCAPWGTPTRNIFGWQRPCYLLNDGYAPSYQSLMETTDWESFGVRKDPRCADCMVHCGFETTAVLDSVTHPLRAMLTNLRGIHPRPGALGAISPSHSSPS
jgi:hopanoid biosynthesis associated radical SAM protein HpnH